MAKKKSVVLTVRITPESVKKYRKAATDDRFDTISGWIRRVCDDYIVERQGKTSGTSR